ncbi:MAG: nucleoid-associated protein, YbaB/EbfC family [Gammaproteobacteria bacterium GWE2_37_16]|nr:MAG: nucleoid-associated protein, YbaB/EbfC family [Gammaproteobacteria bacterium GWE2_37_16]
MPDQITPNQPTTPNQPDLNELMKKAQEIQQKMKWAQTELASIHVTGSAGGDAIQITLNGHRKVLSVKIDDATLKESKEVMQDLITAAFNDAMDKIEKVAQEKMMKLAKDFGLPEDIK